MTSGIVDFTVPPAPGEPAAAPGDWLLMTVHCERSPGTPPPTISIPGFDLLGEGTGATAETEVLSDSVWSRVWNGTEPWISSMTVEGAEWVSWQCWLIRGVDPVAPFAIGHFDYFGPDTESNIPAVTTTVDDTLVLVLWSTFQVNPSGPSQTAGPTLDGPLFSHAFSYNLGWTSSAATAGAFGPWTIDRTGEEDPGNPVYQGGCSVTVLIQPPSGDPEPDILTLEWDHGPPSGPAPALPPVTIYGPNGEVAVIGGSTLEEQAALEAAQRAVWAAGIAVGDFLDHLQDDIDANTAWLAGDTSGSDPQLVALTEQVTRIQRYLAPPVEPIVGTVAVALGDVVSAGGALASLVASAGLMLDPVGAVATGEFSIPVTGSGDVTLDPVGADGAAETM